MEEQSELLFSQRPEWADITPVPQDDGPNPLVPIAYAPDYSDAMNYFRAILLKNEKSPRVLELTEFIVRLNPGHYTVWKYRQDTVFALGKDLKEELEFIEDMAEDQPKSYQIWHYRQAMVQKLGDGSKEIDFINFLLAQDSKNYHAWSYRQWVVSTFQLWDGELPDVDRLLSEDVRNNSAWNQRYWVYKTRPAGFTQDDLKAEVTYALEKIVLAPRNESPWSYLKGIVALGGKTLEDFPEIEQTCRDLSNSGEFIAHALALLLDLEGKRNNAQECRRICTLLEEHDPVRRKYWQYRAQQVA